MGLRKGRAEAGGCAATEEEKIGLKKKREKSNILFKFIYYNPTYIVQLKNEKLRAEDFLNGGLFLEPEFLDGCSGAAVSGPFLGRARR